MGVQSTRSAVVAFLCAVAALFVGIWLGGHPESLPDPIRNTFVDEDRALRAEVVDTIKDNFYKPVDEDKLENASLKGIVGALDVTPAELRRALREVARTKRTEGLDELARFLADRFNLPVDKVEKALDDSLPPPPELGFRHGPGPGFGPPGRQP